MCKRREYRPVITLCKDKHSLQRVSGAEEGLPRALEEDDAACPYSLGLARLKSTFVTLPWTFPGFLSTYRDIFWVLPGPCDADKGPLTVQGQFNEEHQAELYMRTYIQKDRQTDRKTDRQTDRQTTRHTDSTDIWESTSRVSRNSGRSRPNTPDSLVFFDKCLIFKIYCIIHWPCGHCMPEANSVLTSSVQAQY